MTLGQSLRYLREDRGIGLEAMAEALHLSPETLRHVEADTYKPDWRAVTEWLAWLSSPRDTVVAELAVQLAGLAMESAWDEHLGPSVTVQ